MQLLHVRWRDAHHLGAGEWVNVDDATIGVQVVTVGLLVRETRHYLVLAASVTSEGDCTGVFAVPRSAVIESRVLAA